jgi:lipopolysaccharide export LptBFGC system permease protein LptF
VDQGVARTDEGPDPAIAVWIVVAIAVVIALVVLIRSLA